MRTSTLILAALSVLSASRAVSADPPREPVEDILCRARSAVGYSYAWGGECWCASGCRPDFDRCRAGSCSGSCPSCTHSGTYGADCSGFVSRAWQVPRAIPVDACGTDRYVASNFTSDHAFWDIVSTSSLRPGDSLASSSHVFMVVGGRDGSGDYDIIEARGCSYGIVHRRRSASGYTGARRINITECNCDEGASEDRDCGDCGTQRRRCADGCSWSSWSECEGSDPGASCTVEGASGVCAEGTSLCVAGWLTCSPPSASADVCDGRDNDCDGVVDNGTPETLGEGFPCTNDCGDGVSRCLDGAVTCVNPGPDGTDEICDGEDTGPPDTGPPDDASPDTGPPDDASPDVGPADAGGPDDGGGSGLALGGVRGGCSCRTPGGSSAEPFAPALALAALLGL